jgi:protein-S-isoprenylcysteine O-methyltransferase Ste14
VSELARKALAGLIRFQSVLALLLFLPAWSLRFWQAWAYWGLFTVSVLSITTYFLKHDPELIRRRLEVGPGAEPQKRQRVIQTVASLAVLTLYLIPGFDHRFHWSAVPVPVVVAADALVAAGFLVIFLVFRTNSYTSGVVTVEPGQRVVSTGPYRLVRHPMYSGASLLFLATPPALGSWWALPAAVALCGVMVVRLLDEERFLAANLDGYDAYRRRVGSRLLPMVW